MANLDSSRSHPTTEMLEEYAFNRLSEFETETIEEHLLVCPTCQNSLAEVDEYILLVKHAAASRGSTVRGTPKKAALEAFAALLRKVPAVHYAVGTMAIAACITLTIAMRTVPGDGPPDIAHPEVVRPEVIHLVALRGAEISRAHVGRALDLNIDLTGLQEADAYHVEIVDANGLAEWSGEATGSGNSRSLQIARKFKSGQHWVRLYSNAALQREFGLRIE